MRDLQGSLDDACSQHAEGCVKTASDLERYRAVLAGVQPTHIIEIGTFSGRSACWFAAQSGAQVISVDIDPSNISPGTRHLADDLGVVFLLGRSTELPLATAIQRWARRAKTVMVVLDGDHSADTVAGELLLYAPLVSVGSYCVVEDGLVRWMPEQQVAGGGPYRGSPLDAIEEFMEDNDHWMIDLAIEDLRPTTQFPGGWLRRLR
jgi:cephalosporin hydroxylase